MIKANLPYQYFLEIRVNDVHLCVGAYAHVLTGYHVVTVASCVVKYEEKKLKVYMANKNGVAFPSDIKKKMIHPRFREKRRIFNLALLKMSESFTRLSEPAKLVLSSKSTEMNNCVMHSIKPPFTIESTDVEYIRPKKCREIYKKKGKSHILDDLFLCMGSKNEKCNKQFGFMFVCDKIYLAGIGLEGAVCCGVHKPYLAFSMDKFHDWVMYGQDRSGSLSIFQRISFTKIYVIIITLLFMVEF